MARAMPKDKYLWIGIIATISSVFAIGSAITLYKVYAGEYDKSQAILETSECGNEFIATNIFCSNSGSDMQGDENVVASTFSQRAPISLPPEIITDGFLTIKEAIIKPFGEPNPPTGNENGGLNAFLKTHAKDGQGGVIFAQTVSADVSPAAGPQQLPIT